MTYATAAGLALVVFFGILASGSRGELRGIARARASCEATLRSQNEHVAAMEGIDDYQRKKIAELREQVDTLSRAVAAQAGALRAYEKRLSASRSEP